MIIHRMMQFIFHLLYHPFAWGYDLVAAVTSLGKWQKWVRAVIPLITGPKVLEIGFGPGHLQQAMLEQNLEVFGLDESHQMSRIAFRRLADHQQLVRGHAQFLPFASQTFQTIVATFPAGYIFDTLTAEEAYRVTAPGGKMVILLGAWLTGRSLPEQFMRLLFRITGQLPSEGKTLFDLARAPYIEAGFQTDAVYLDLPGSRLLVLIAKLPENSN